MKPLYLILGIILAIILNVTLTKPAVEAQPALKSERQAVETEYRAAEAKINQLPALRSELSTKQQQLAELQNDFPAHEELGILIRSLQQAADQNRLTITEITRTSEPAPIPGFNEIKLTLSADGTFPALYRYLDWAKKQERILNVTAIASDSGRSHKISVTGYTRSEQLPEASAAPETSDGSQPDGTVTTGVTE